jgi:SAM-dependent methyltransferase
MSCKLCSSQSYKIIGKPRINNDFPRVKMRNYKIVQCLNCNLYYIEPEIDLTEIEWKSLYNSEYFSGRESEWISKLHEQERIERLNLIKNLTPVSIKNFLDFGCGQGYVLREASRRGWNGFGLDIADNLHPDIKKENIKFFHGNLFEAKYPDEYFEAIYMDSVLEHILNPKETLLELKRILKSNGSLYVVVPNEDCLQNDFIRILYTITFKRKLYGRIKPFVSPYHIQGFSKRSLVSAFKIIGLELKHLKDFGGNYQFFQMHPLFSSAYIKELLLYPLGLISIILKNQIQLEALVIKSTLN